MSIARALTLNPEGILFDEPTLVLGIYGLVGINIYSRITEVQFTIISYYCELKTYNINLMLFK